jgi:hypothetical protein
VNAGFGFTVRVVLGRAVKIMYKTFGYLSGNSADAVTL